MKDRVMEEVKRLFRPEFLNRIDDIIVFHPLNMENIREIAGIMTASIAGRTKEQMNIALTVDSSARDYLAEKGYDEKYGARPLRRTIQTMIEDRLAEEILAGTFKSGDTVAVKKGKEGLIFSKKVKRASARKAAGKTEKSSGFLTGTVIE